MSGLPPVPSLPRNDYNNAYTVDVPRMEDLDTMLDISQLNIIDNEEPEDYYEETNEIFPSPSITTFEIMKFYDEGKNNLDTKAQEEQESREYSLKDSLIRCKKSFKNIYDFNYNFANNLINNESINYEAFFELQCVLNYLFKDIGELSHQVIIRKYIKNLRKIGAPSIGGDVYTSDFNADEDFIILKTNSKSSGISFIHELFIGLVLNQTREDIPNFVFTFGGFDCSMPVDPETKIISYCKKTDFNIEYIMLENLKNTTSLADFIRDGCTVDEFLMIFLQILYALTYANERFDFTHYDLHGDNVLLKFYKEEYSIPYETENGIEYLNTNITAHIIDYGMSHIKYKGNHYGIFGYERFAKYPNASYYLSDAYNLLCKCIDEAARNKQEHLIDPLTMIFEFFNREDNAVDAVYKQRQYHHMLPPLKLFPDLTNLDLATYIRKFNFNIDITMEPKALVLNCKMNKNLCVDAKTIHKEFKINQMPVDDLLELLHQILEMSDEELKKARNDDLLLIYYDLYQKYKKKIEEIKSLYTIKILVLKNNKPEIIDNKYILTVDYVDQLKKFLINCIEISDIIDSYFNEYNINRIIAEKLEVKQNETDDPIKLFKDFIQIKLKTLNQIQKLTQSKFLQDPKSLNSKVAKFYFSDLENYILLI